jgi:glycosyltransferase involved in cell wall biosynthesis
MRADTDNNMLSVVIPVFKSQTTLVELHGRLSKLLNESGGGEVIYVNDASPDNSLEILRKLPPTIPFRILSLTTNQGQSTALICGLKIAAHRFVATMDADLQDRPEIVADLLEHLSPQTDVVFAARSGTYETLPRHITSFFFKSIVYLFSVGRIPRQAGLFMVIRKKSCEQFAHFLPKRPYLIGLIARTRLKCTSIVVNRQKNSRNETSYTLRKRLKVASAFFRTLCMRHIPSDDEVEKWWSAEVTEIPPLYRQHF